MIFLHFYEDLEKLISSLLY